MQKDRKGGHAFTFKNAQRQAFHEVFNLHARDGKINASDLKQMFNRIGYRITEEHFKEACEKVFEFKEEVTFEEFINIFKIKDSPYSLVDIANAFRLIAGESDEVIPLDVLYEIYRKNGLGKDYVDDLLLVLSDYVDEKNKQFRFAAFLQQLQ